jgi:hypoxanthine phosphoribosyltransferase
MKRQLEKQKLLGSYEQGIWYDYGDIYDHTKILYEQLSSSERVPIFIAVGRGAWIVMRILSAFYEANNKEHYVYSVISTYDNTNSVREKPVLSQGLDVTSVEAITRLLQSARCDLWIIDAPFVTGGTIKFIKTYLKDLFDVGSKVAVLHRVEFESIESAPWRVPPTADLPDIVAKTTTSNGVSWYVQYPWEWTDLSLYNLVCQAYRQGDSIDKLEDLFTIN